MGLAVINAILLFSFSLPVVFRYRILPINGTPYWLFGVLFLLLTANFLFGIGQSRFLKVSDRIKNTLLAAILLIVVGGSSLTAIVDRARTAPSYGVHDIILQQEAAMRYLLEGKNPYKETYFGTLVESFHYEELGKPAINPALYHFVMPPWYLLFPFAFYFLSLPLFGFFDGRLALLFCLLGLLIVIYKWFKDKEFARLAVILTALSPATIDYFVEGRSDVFALFWLGWSLYLLERRKLIWSGLIFGLALMSKQTIWFAAPFYLYFLWLQEKKSMVQTVKSLIPLVLTSALVVIPFLIWDYRAFLDSVIFYLSGSTTNSYPVSGYGWGMVLYSIGVIKNIHAYYPFAIWQTIIGLPLIIGLCFWISKKLVISRLLISYGFSLLVIWYFSRYFNNSHLGYIASIFVLGGLKQLDE